MKTLFEKMRDNRKKAFQVQLMQSVKAGAEIIDKRMEEYNEEVDRRRKQYEAHMNAVLIQYADLTEQR